jgi:hypothetical protein
MEALETKPFQAKRLRTVTKQTKYRILQQITERELLWHISEYTVIIYKQYMLWHVKNYMQQ